MEPLCYTFKPSYKTESTSQQAAIGPTPASESSHSDDVLRRCHSIGVCYPLRKKLETFIEEGCPLPWGDLWTKVVARESPDPPQEFLCPITLEVMEDPVFLTSGETYDRCSIQLWFSSGKNYCPNTMQPVDVNLLVPNRLLRSQIREWQGNAKQYPRRNPLLSEYGSSATMSALLPSLCDDESVDCKKVLDTETSDSVSCQEADVEHSVFPRDTEVVVPSDVPVDDKLLWLFLTDPKACKVVPDTETTDSVSCQEAEVEHSVSPDLAEVVVPSDVPVDNKLLWLFLTDPKAFGKLLTIPKQTCLVTHEFAVAVAALIASAETAEKLLQRGVLLPLVSLLASSRFCCRVLALETISALLRCPAPIINSQGNVSSSRWLLKRLIPVGIYPKGNWLQHFAEDSKLIQHVVAVLQHENATDAHKQAAVDLLCFLASNNCYSPKLDKRCTVRTLVDLLHTSDNSNLRQACVQLLSLLPKRSVKACGSMLHNAVPCLIGMLSTQSPEEAAGALSILRCAFKADKLCGQAFADNNGLAALEHTLQFPLTTKLTLEILIMVAKNVCTSSLFQGSTVLEAVAAVAQSPDQELVQLSGELLSMVPHGESPDVPDSVTQGQPPLTGPEEGMVVLRADAVKKPHGIGLKASMRLWKNALLAHRRKQETAAESAD